MENNLKSGNNENTRKIKQKIGTFLESFRTNGNQKEFTHVSLGGSLFPGKYNISNKRDRLKLAKYLGKTLDKNISVSIAEMPLEYGPIIVDLDFKFPYDSYKEEFKSEHIYNNELILSIINHYKTSINQYLDINDNELQCYMFEKTKGVEKNGEYKDGVHLMFPFICTDSKIRQLIYNNVQELVDEESLFEKYSNPESILDDSIINCNAWLMYGCCKPNLEPYILSKIYSSNNQEIDIKTLGSNEDIIKILSLRDDKKYKQKYSTKYKNNITDEYILEKYTNLGLCKGNSPAYFDDEELSEDAVENIEKAMVLVDMLHIKRANDYNDWIRLGWVLHNIDDSLLSKWVEFSKKSKKFKNGECEKEWSKMRSGGLTIRSLCLWAKEDSPDQYIKYNKEFFDKLLKKNDVNNTFMIAKALYYQYADRFICTDTSKDSSWYEFKQNRWRKCQCGGSLITLMSSDFVNIYSNIVTDLNKDSQNVDGGEKKSLLQQIELYNKICQKLMDITFKKKILEEAKYLFLDTTFLSRLDENYHLIGFENGVYDLEQRKFRKGHPDDYISLSTKNKYHKWSDKNPYANQIKSFFSQILTNENVRNFFLQRLSTCISGENREEKFYFCTGSGSNGKSLTFQLVSDALGDYYISCPITIITRKRNASNAASPELARMKGPRAGVFQEPGHQEEINVGIFKELTGNDKIMVRGLFKDPNEIKPQTKYWCCCNDLPAITSDDGGTWRRVLVVDFSSKFVDEPKKPNEFKIDTKLKDKIKNWAPAFASYLIHIYNTEYNIPGNKLEPEEVKISTNKYRQNQDIIRDYFDSCLERTKDKEDKINKRSLAQKFGEWFKLEHEGSTRPKNIKIYEFIDSELEQKYSNGWKYIKFKTDESDEDQDSDEE